MVHGASSDIIASPTDVDLGFAMPRALRRDAAVVRERRPSAWTTFRAGAFAAAVLPVARSRAAAVAPAAAKGRRWTMRRIRTGKKNGPKNSDGGLTINGDASKDLTEDEELLLDRHRRFSRSERTKLRLACLSPHGGKQEMEIALSPSSGLPKASGGASSTRESSLSIAR